MSNKKRLAIIVQTTFNNENFEIICKQILKKLSVNRKLQIDIVDTICDATKERQEETEKIAKQADLMIIIGGKNSSNSNKLYEIAKENCKNVLFIETKDELDINKIKEFKKIGIMAGASTPTKNIDQIVDILKKTC